MMLLCSWFVTLQLCIDSFLSSLVVVVGNTRHQPHGWIQTSPKLSPVVSLEPSVQSQLRARQRPWGSERGHFLTSQARRWRISPGHLTGTKRRDGPFISRKDPDQSWTPRGFISVTGDSHTRTLDPHSLPGPLALPPSPFLPD